MEVPGFLGILLLAVCALVAGAVAYLFVVYRAQRCMEVAQ